VANKHRDVFVNLGDRAKALAGCKRICYHHANGEARRSTGWLLSMKFTTLVPTTWNNGMAVKPAVLQKLIHILWRPFGGVTNEGYVTGHWIDANGAEFCDVCIKLSIECDRSRLAEAISAVKRVGRRLEQRAMYFEVAGYDGVQILRID
jgi:hypothetical protein